MSSLRLFLFALLASASSALAAVDPATIAAAHAFFDQHKNTEALAAFTKIASEDPQLAEAPYYLGMLALRRNDPEAAVPYFQRAAELNPTAVPCRLRLGDAYGMMAQKAGLFAKLGLARKCRAQYESAVALDAQSVDAHASLLEFYKQAPGIAGGSFEKAHEQADLVAKLAPGYGRWLNASIYVAQKKYDEVFRAYEGVIALDPPDYGALNQFGQLAMMTGTHLDEGLIALKKCLAMTPPPNEAGHVWLSYVMGRIYEAKNDKSAARAAYEATLALDANFKPASDALQKLN